MKLSTIKHAIIKIFSDRNIQLTIALFGIGFLLALTATYPALGERIEKDTLSENEKLEARLPDPYDEPAEPDPLNPGEPIPFLEKSGLGLVNASLELRGESDDTNVTVRTLNQAGQTLDSWHIEGRENKTLNLTGNQEIEYINFHIENGELSYNYVVRYYHQPYSLLSIPAYILMWISVIFLIRAIALIGPLRVDEKERDKIRKDQKVIDKILRDKKEKK
ncbi:MAG: hypothetical protein KGY66_01280 [Candidatus Thermoplasmatota archaeon]|nr:hypothetical protein [Candidatus Thermoplasmatota archaeon]MBS3789530.1 hypothetical protein [Candidatus Thermoplasmatota archaeon]